MSYEQFLELQRLLNRATQLTQTALDIETIAPDDFQGMKFDLWHGCGNVERYAILQSNLDLAELEIFLQGVAWGATNQNG